MGILFCQLVDRLVNIHVFHITATPRYWKRFIIKLYHDFISHTSMVCLLINWNLPAVILIYLAVISNTNEGFLKIVIQTFN